MTLIQQPGGGLPDNLPLLTQVADEDAPDDLPTLTEAVPDIRAEPDVRSRSEDKDNAPVAEKAMPASAALSEAETQRLLRLIESHIENIFTYQLNINLEQMHRTAIQHAVNDLKAELPMLLREALNRRPGL